MILCFSATGNSRLVARQLASELGDHIISLNDVMKNHEPLEFESTKPFVIVTPIYAWRLPRVLEDLLSKSSFKGNRNIYFVVTMGQQTGQAITRCKDICDATKTTFKGFCGVPMPDNYIISYEVESVDEVHKIVTAAKAKVHALAEQINKGETIEKDDKTPFGWFMSSVVNSAMYSGFVNNPKFNLNEKCSGCGKCAQQCPMNNIKMENGKPVFGKQCMLCLGCLNNCPCAAIEFGKKTVGKERYHGPEQ